MGDSWIAERAALRASSSLLGVDSAPEASVETLDESKFVEGKTRLGLEGSRPMRRFAWTWDNGRGPGPENGPTMDATARPTIKLGHRGSGYSLGLQLRIAIMGRDYVLSRPTFHPDWRTSRDALASTTDSASDSWVSTHQSQCHHPTNSQSPNPDPYPSPTARPSPDSNSSADSAAQAATNSPPTAPWPHSKAGGTPCRRRVAAWTAAVAGATYSGAASGQWAVAPPDSNSVDGGLSTGHFSVAANSCRQRD